MQVLTQRIEQRGPRVEFELDTLTVDIEEHLKDGWRRRRNRLAVGGQRYCCGPHGSRSDQQLTPSHVEVVTTFHDRFSIGCPLEVCAFAWVFPESDFLVYV